jgi:hypothetical protein
MTWVIISGASRTRTSTYAIPYDTETIASGEGEAHARRGVVKLLGNGKEKRGCVRRLVWAKLVSVCRVLVGVCEKSARRGITSAAGLSSGQGSLRGIPLGCRTNGSPMSKGGRLTSLCHVENPYASTARPTVKTLGRLGCSLEEHK